MPTNRIFHLQDYGLIKVAGAGALNLLQGQISCDVTKVTPESGSMGVHCNPQGRIIFLFYLMKTDNDYFLAIPKRMTVIVINSLKKYAPFYKAELTDASQEYSVMGCLGDITMQHYSRVVFAPSSSLAMLLTEPTDSADSSEEWKSINIAAGIPAIYPETSGAFLPHELNLPALGAIDFNKGCYTGQEIIARMHYRANLKKHMYLALAQQPLNPGEEIQPKDNPGKAIAIAIDSSRNPVNGKYPTLIIANDQDIESGLITQQGLTIESKQSEIK